MKLRRIVIAIAVSLASTGCGGDAAAPGPQPGQLAVILISPNAVDGGLILHVNTAQPVSTFTTPSTQTVAIGRIVDRTTRTVVAGHITPGELFRFNVPNVNDLTGYSSAVLEVADAQNALRTDLSGYRVELRAVR